jgi:hypothetical protein
LFPRGGSALSGALAQRALFLHRPLGRRKCLEALVRDRLATFDGEPIRAGGQTLLRTVDCGEPIAKVFSQPFVELVQIEVCSKIRRLEPAGVVTVILMPATVKRLLEFAPLGGKQRPSTFGVHQRSPSRYSAYQVDQSSAGSTSPWRSSVRYAQCARLAARSAPAS